MDMRHGQQLLGVHLPCVEGKQCPWGKQCDFTLLSTSPVLRMDIPASTMSEIAELGPTPPSSPVRVDDDESATTTAAALLGLRAAESVGEAKAAVAEATEAEAESVPSLKEFARGNPRFSSEAEVRVMLNVEYVKTAHAKKNLCLYFGFLVASGRLSPKDQGTRCAHLLPSPLYALMTPAGVRLCRLGKQQALDLRKAVHAALVKRLQDPEVEHDPWREYMTCERVRQPAPTYSLPYTLPPLPLAVANACRPTTSRRRSCLPRRPTFTYSRICLSAALSSSHSVLHGSKPSTTNQGMCRRR